MGCMNPKAGSFNIDTRLQRHYTVMSCLTAERAIHDQIYRQILEAHLRTFDPTIAPLAPKFIQANIDSDLLLTPHNSCLVLGNSTISSI